MLGSATPAAAPPKPAAPAPAAPAPVAPPPIPQPVVAATPSPMTAVEQRGPRVYASPMAKKLAETQKLRLEGKQFCLHKYSRVVPHNSIQKNYLFRLSKINKLRKSCVHCVIRTRQRSLWLNYI